MSSFAQGILQDLAIDKFNQTAEDKIHQKDPYSLPPPQGLSKRDADILRRCKRRAHQLDHNAVLCYCCPCFFGLNTAICRIPRLLQGVLYRIVWRVWGIGGFDWSGLLSWVSRGVGSFCLACSWRWELSLGLIPIIGPIWANSLSGRVIKMAEEADIPATLTAKMTANITFDFLVRTLPSLRSSPFPNFHVHFEMFLIYVVFPSINFLLCYFASICFSPGRC